MKLIELIDDETIKPKNKANVDNSQLVFSPLDAVRFQIEVDLRSNNYLIIHIRSTRIFQKCLRNSQAVETAGNYEELFLLFNETTILFLVKN